MDLTTVMFSEGLPWFAERLNRLFETVPADAKSRPPRFFTNAEIAATVRDFGVRCSEAHMSLMRNGSRNNPSAALVVAISAAFGRNPMYLIDASGSDLEVLLDEEYAAPRLETLRASGSVVSDA